jgi:hypothetical protein
METQPSMPWVRSNSGRKQISRASQVFEGQFDEQFLAVESRLGLLTNAVIVSRRMGDSLVEDGRVRGQTGDGQLVDVASQRAVIEDLAGDVVEPNALAEIVQAFRGGHGSS